MQKTHSSSFFQDLLLANCFQYLGLAPCSAHNRLPEGGANARLKLEMVCPLRYVLLAVSAITAVGLAIYDLMRSTDKAAADTPNNLSPKASRIPRSLLQVLTALCQDKGEVCEYQPNNINIRCTAT